MEMHDYVYVKAAATPVAICLSTVFCDPKTDKDYHCDEPQNDYYKCFVFFMNGNPTWQ